MLLNFGANDKYRLVTSAIGEIDTVASFMDASNADPPVVKGSTSQPEVHTITTATTTDLIGAPGAGAIRSSSSVFIRNVHATVAQDVLVILDRSGTIYEVWKTNLLPGDVLAYEDGLGWFKTAAADPTLQYLRKGSDQTHALTSFIDISGLGFAVVAGGVYEIEAEVIWTTATVTVGAGIAVNGPASPASINGTAAIFGGNPQTTLGDNAYLGFTAYDTGPLSTSAPVINTNYVARLACLLENGPNAGTLALRWRSETATTTTVKAGSYATCKRLK